jgi:hypothetical protein
VARKREGFHHVRRRIQATGLCEQELLSPIPGLIPALNDWEEPKVFRSATLLGDFRNDKKFP